MGEPSGGAGRSGITYGTSMTVLRYDPQNVPAYMGLSSDTKPANVPAGSKFIETDTGNIWLMLNTGVWTQVLVGSSGKIVGTASFGF